MKTFKQFLKENHNKIDEKHIMNTLALYVHLNKKASDFGDVYRAALAMYPKYVYNGVMYRAVRLRPGQDIKDPHLLQKIEKNPSEIRGWTTSKEYASHPSSNYTVAVYKQHTSGLDIKVVYDRYHITHGVAFHNNYEYEEEILAPTSPNAVLINVVQSKSDVAPYSADNSQDHTKDDSLWA
jgi:hypothetical protein